MTGRSQVLGTKGNHYANEALLAFTGGLVWDQQLIHQEMRVQHAWLVALQKGGVLSLDEAAQIASALESIQAHMIDGTFVWQEADEDIHMNIERAVTEQLGELGKKMHTGRSRNDLIATTLRLFVADQCDEQAQLVAGLVEVLIAHARDHVDTLIPAMTHLQNGQPISLAQVLLAHAWAFARDLKSLQHAKQMAMHAMPLGAAACNGTTLTVDFTLIAEQLGFATPCLNSYDAIGSRDELMIFHDAMALNSVHVARLAQDVILWASSAMGLAKLDPNWSTGSSIMPNKRNPDVAELARAKAARLQSASQTVKQIGSQLGSSYFSDFHELKKVTIEATNLWHEIYSVLPGFVAGLTFDQETAKKLLSSGHVLATDYANQLTENGMSFRDAYKEVVTKVNDAERQGVQIDDLVPGLSARQSVSQRNASGGTSSTSIRHQLTSIQATLASWKDQA